MGGEYQEQILTVAAVSTLKELKEEYARIVADHLYMDGHGGYSGTFAEKPQLTIISQEAGEFGREDARDHCVQNNDKWGPSFAYRISPTEWYIGGWCSS